MAMNTEPREDQTIFVLFAVMLVVMFVIPTVYAAKASIINSALLTVSKLQLSLFLSFSEEASKAWAYISTLDPATMTWDDTYKVLSYTGKWSRWPLGVLLALLTGLCFCLGRVNGLTRRFNMRTLLQHNKEVFPCLRPVAGRGDYLLSPDSRDTGAWRMARSPVQFALEHSLLLTEDGKPFPKDDALTDGLGDSDLLAYGQCRFDAKAAEAVFKAQLGNTFAGLDSLSPLRMTLAAALMAYAGGDKKQSIQVLDEVATAYKEVDGKPECSLFTDDRFLQRMKELADKHSKILNDRMLTKHISYELPWFMALLNRAHKKGVLAPSQFIWLRPMDRPLWYALHQCGGRAAWSEASAPWAHYQAEDKKRKTLATPSTSGAVTGLYKALDAQGWLLADTPRPAAAAEQPAPVANLAQAPMQQTIKPASSEQSIVPANASYLDAEPFENDDNYDANEDSLLRNEQY